MQAVNNLKMNRQVVVFLVVLVFFFLLEDFKKLKGFEFPLLKIIVKLIGVILFLVVFLHKKEIFWHMTKIYCLNYSMDTTKVF